MRPAVLAAALLLGLLTAGGLGYGAGYQLGIGTSTTTPTTTDVATTTTTTDATTTAPPTTTTTTDSTSTSTTTTTTEATTTAPAPGGEQSETAQPGQPGSLTVSSQVSVQWTGATFAAPTTLTVDPSPALGVTLAGAGNVLVSVTAADSSTGNPVSSFAAPLELVFPQPPAGYVPVVSEDGVHFRALGQIAGPPLPASRNDGYYVAADGIHILTRHLTIFAVLAPANASKWGDVAHADAPALTIVKAPALTGTRVSLVVSVDAPVALSLQLLASGGRTVATKTVTVRAPGAVPLSLRIVRGRKGALMLVVSAVGHSGGKSVKRVALRVP
jgi:hypothetical protein